MSKEQVSGSLTLSLGGLADEVAEEVVTRLASTLRELAQLPQPPAQTYHPREAMEILIEVMPDLGSPGGGLYFDKRDVALQMTHRLAEKGLALIQLPQTQEVPPATETESAVDWFKREVDL